MKQRTAILLAALTGASCSAVVDTGRHTAGEDLAPTDFCIEYADAICSGHSSCCAMPINRAECVASAISQCSMVDEVLSDERVAYDARAAARYLAMGQSLADACDPDIVDLLDQRQFLAAILAGTVGAGDVCTPDDWITDVAAYVQCERGLVCEFGLPEFRCVPTGEAGARCVNNFGCEPPLVCLASGDGMMTCQPPLELGEACTGNQFCASKNCARSGLCEARSVEASYFCDAASMM